MNDQYIEYKAKELYFRFEARKASSKEQKAYFKAQENKYKMLLQSL